MKTYTIRANVVPDPDIRFPGYEVNLSTSFRVPMPPDIAESIRADIDRKERDEYDRLRKKFGGL